MTSPDLHPSTHLRAAAWVPDDVEDRPWEDAIALAADWIWERSQDEDSAPHLPNQRVNAGLDQELLDFQIILGKALLQRLAAVRGRLSLCADQAAAAKWWLSMPTCS